MNPDKLEDLMLGIKDDLGKMNVKLGKIDTKLDADYLAIHGNGKPGILSKLEDINARVIKLEEKNKHTGTLWILIGFLVNTVISIASFFK